MCGIGAVIARIDVGRMERIVGAIVEAQSHRGPDDQGTAVLAVGDYAVGLGNRRLAILDISPLGRQPMANPGTGDVLAYNGEIYNSPELRRELESASHVFRGRSDTEVLLHAYEQWGTGCLDRLRGMFAFALWDARARKLVVARDHLGIKPLYWARLHAGGFACASELRALMASGLIASDIDVGALAGYLAYGAVQEPRTIERDVRMLGPASWMEVDLAGNPGPAQTYWELPRPRRTDRRTGDLIAEGRSLLRQAVRRHLLSDVPIGVFLSSGLDSTAVAGTAHHVSDADVRAFTVTFPDERDFDEGPLARRAARDLGVSHTECPVSASTALAWAEKALSCMDQPTSDGLNAYIVSRAVRERSLVVALSGQGGDEVFAGYGTFRNAPLLLRLLRPLSLLGPDGREALASALALPLSGPARKKARAMARTGSDIAGLYFHSRRLFSDDELASCGFDAPKLGLSNTWHPLEADPRCHVIEDDPIATVGRLETLYYLGNTLLRDGDVFGMANSLEIRVPLLDRDIVDWAFHLPGETLRPPCGPNKPLLRGMCADLYGDAQARQPKRGFTLPLRTWMLDPLRELVADSLRSVRRSGLVRPDGVDRARASFLREPRSSAWSRLWALVALGRWLDDRGSRPGGHSHGEGVLPS